MMTENPFYHEDSLAALYQKGGLADKIKLLHQRIEANHPVVERVAIALYDASTDFVKTLVYSSHQPTPLAHYEAKLSEASSLMETAKLGKTRVVNDMHLFEEGTHKHTRAFEHSSYQASYTMPLYGDGCLLGFVFFNATEVEAFTEALMTELDLIGHFVAMLVHTEISKIHTLMATIKTAQQMAHKRDVETGAHLERMAHYAHIIALELAVAHDFSDQFVEDIYLYAPMHDIGKIGIPDNILLKPGKLTEHELTVMQRHTLIGKEMVDQLLDNYGLDGVENIDMIRNIALYHHEAVDGTGYPEHRKGNSIPFEARIVKVADIFDALTSTRPYKSAWDNDRAFAHLREMAGHQLDEACVAALCKHSDQVVDIQKRFAENCYG